MKPTVKNFKYLSAVLLPVIFIMLLLDACTQKSNKNDVGTTDTSVTSESLSRPSWLDKEPIVIVGNWDSMPIFRRRVGGNPVWQEEDYKKEHSEEAVKKLKEMGVTMAVIHFYKGFGLEAEKEHMDDAKVLADLCKKYGIRVGVYIGSTIAYETFLLEKPEAEKWFFDDFFGQPVRYGAMQTFRKRVYFMHPEYIDYIKRVVRIAVEDFKVDLIHFDNTSLRAQAAIFFHPLAIENFRVFLTKKYTPEMLKLRLGFSNVKYVEPPPYNRPISTIDDPLFQEWTDFRCQQLADFYGEMERYIHSLNPEVVVENNPHSGMSGNNIMWDQGVDYPRLLSHTDIVWTEEGNEAAVTSDGILVSKIRTYKMASTLKNKIFTYTSDSKLQMAEAMAYNRQCLGMVGGALAGDELPEGQRKYLNFYHKNFEYYRDIDNVADVAVLHSFPTMAFNNDRPYQSTFLFEQALIQSKIPFDIIFDDNLKDLTKYRLLILADQECLSDEKLDLIRNFVKQGGGLVATEHTSLYTEWRQRKRDMGLQDLFQLKVKIRRSDGSDKILNIFPEKNQFGNGRVVYIAEIKPVIEKPPTEGMRSKYWKLPVNWETLIESVKWASGNDLSIEIMNAPHTVTMELIKNLNGNTIMVHLLNYDVARNPQVKNIRVIVELPKGKKVEQVTLLSPDNIKTGPIDYKAADNHLTFKVSELETYDLVVVKMNE